MDVRGLLLFLFLFFLALWVSNFLMTTFLGGLDIVTRSIVSVLIPGTILFFIWREQERKVEQ